jgi:hypothetical protein
MASPPLTDREYAYFYVLGPGTHESVTDITGLKPSQAWNAGDRSEQTGRVQKLMRWRLDSGLDDTEPLERHIESLLLFLIPREEQLRKLWLDYDLVIQCVGYYPPSGHGAHLNREVIRQAARLGLALDLDFYYQDEHGHDG